MDNEIAEQMASLLGFVIYNAGGEVRLPKRLFTEPPAEDLMVEAIMDEVAEELIIRLVPLDAG